MSIYTERKYLLQLSNTLGLFKQKKPDLWEFRCPFCGDSQKDKLKCRGYVYRNDDRYHFKCHNCTEAHGFPKFLEMVNPLLYREFIMEKFKPKEVEEDQAGTIFKRIEKKPVFTASALDLKTIAQLPQEHPARVYCVGRCLPTAALNRLFYAPDFKTFIDELYPDHGTRIPDGGNDERLVIPFFDSNKKLIGLQGRTLTDHKIRYITIKLDENAVKLYGLDRVNKKEKIYVTEGPLDSEFLPNAVATMDSDLTKANPTLSKDRLVLVYDNQPRNKDIVRNVRKAIENNFTVCIWEDGYGEKDINDMVKSGITPEQVKAIIDRSTFSALRAKLELNRWKKI